VNGSTTYVGPGVLKETRDKVGETFMEHEHPQVYRQGNELPKAVGGIK
jgi:hypothetical protein